MVFIEVAALPAVITPLPPKKRRVKKDTLEIFSSDVTAEPSARDSFSSRQLDGFLLLAVGGEAEDPMSITSADLSSLSITEICQDDLPYFCNLHKLDLSDNMIKDDNVLDALSRLSRLKHLSLACNHLSDIKLEEMLIKLEILNLSYNELQGEVMPAIAAGCPRLNQLDMSNNCVSSVPPCAGFTMLTELNLANNDLVQYDQWRALEQLPILAKLNLSGNRIKRLKNEVAVELSEEEKMTSFRVLNYIDLSDNEIGSVANLDVLFDFPALTVVKVKGNPWPTGQLAPPSSRHQISFVFEGLGGSHGVLMATRTFVTVPEQKMHLHKSPWKKYVEQHGEFCRTNPETEGLLPLADIDRRLEASRTRCLEELETVEAKTYGTALRTPPFAMDTTTKNQMHVIKRLTTPNFFANMKAQSTGLRAPVVDFKIEQAVLPADAVRNSALDCLEDDFLVEAPDAVKNALISLRLN
jgi:Leucine-rich repeat (LRR) protein